MTTKSRGKPKRKIETLKVKALKSNLTGSVKGGPCPGTNTRPARPGSL